MIPNKPKPMLTIQFVSLIVAVLPAILMFVVLTYMALKNSQTIQTEHLNETVAQMQVLISDTAEFALATGNKVTIERVIKKQIERPDILSIEIQNQQGNIFVRATDAETFGQNQLIQYRSHDIMRAPVGIEGAAQDAIYDDLAATDAADKVERVGRLIIGLNISYINEQRSKQMQSYLLLASIAFAIAVVMAYFVSRLQTEPLSQALNAVRDLRHGELKPSPPVAARIKEIALLSQDIHDLAQQLFDAEEHRALARTEREKYLIQTTQAREEADRANLAKTRFLATVSHELRTPLNTILGMIQILEDTELSPMQSNYLGLASSQTFLLNVLVKDILDFAQLEYGQLRLHLSACTIDEVVEQTFASMAMLTDGKNIKLSLQKDGDPSHYQHSVLTDPTRLKQIIGNLLNNAIKFTLQGAVQMLVGLQRARPDYLKLSVSVKDTGIGISATQIDKIFEFFQQADNSSTKNYEGAGLGLTIATELSKLLNGSISVISTQGVGSTFTFEMELLEHQQDLIEDLNDSTKTQRFNERRVLLVEDNKGSQAVILGLLGLKNIAVDVVDSADQALEKLAQQTYDLILMDCFMPNMDGFALCEALRRSGISKNIPIIGLSADAQDSTRERCFDVGMDDFIAKPIGKFELYRKLERYFLMKQETEEMLRRIGQDDD